VVSGHDRGLANLAWVGSQEAHAALVLGQWACHPTVCTANQPMPTPGISVSADLLLLVLAHLPHLVLDDSFLASRLAGRHPSPHVNPHVGAMGLARSLHGVGPLQYVSRSFHPVAAQIAEIYRPSRLSFDETLTLWAHGSVRVQAVLRGCRAVFCCEFLTGSCSGTGGLSLLVGLQWALLWCLCWVFECAEPLAAAIATC